MFGNKKRVQQRWRGLPKSVRKSMGKHTKTMMYVLTLEFEFEFDGEIHLMKFKNKKEDMIEF